MGELRDFDRNLPMALLRAREAVMGHFRPILHAHNLTEQQWRVIRALHGHDGLEATALSAQTLLLMPSLTRILKLLESQGLVRRYTVAGDKRRRRIRLAAKGRKLYAKIAPQSEAEYEKIAARIGKDELADLYRLLGGFTENFSRE